LNFTKPKLFIFFIFCILTSGAQKKDDNVKDHKTRMVSDIIAGDWTLGFGFNVVDDGGVILGGIFNQKEYSHFNTPFIFYVENFYTKQFSFIASLSFNKYVKDKKVDRRGIILKGEEPSYFAVDIATKYYFRDIFLDYIFEPYIFLGLGYTSIGGHKVNPFKVAVPSAVTVDENGIWNIPSTGNLTFNGGLGVNYWFSKSWGVNFNVAGKCGFVGGKYKEIISNQTQFSVAGYYRL